MHLKKAHSIRLLAILNMIAGFDDLNEIFGTKYKKLTNIDRYVLAPAKEELDLTSKLSFLHEINFDNFGKGRPKAIDITIDLIDNNNNLFST